MADNFLLQSGSPDRILLQDGSGFLILQAGANTAPTVALNSPADAGTVSDATPTLDFTGTDADSDDIRYQVQVANSSVFEPSFSNLTSGSDIVGGTSFSTASISPSSNALVLISFAIRNNSTTNPTVTSVTGNGLTWELVNSSNYDDNSASRRTLFVYRAMGASPTSGAVTIATGETETDVVWSVEEIIGVDTSGTNGAGAVVQSGNNRINTTDPAASSLTVTLSAFSSTRNVAFGAFAESGSGAGMSVGTGFTQLAYVDPTPSTNIALLTERKNSNDNTVDMIMGGSFSGEGGVGLEIKSATLIDAVSGTDAGFANPDNGGDTDPFTSGENIQYTVQAGDTLPDDTYYWRVRGIDPSGTNTYGAWASTNSFTVNTSGGPSPTSSLMMMGVGS